MIHTGCYSSAAGVWSPDNVEVDDCSGRQFVPFIGRQQPQQQVRAPNSAYVDATTTAVRYGVAPAPYEHTVRYTRTISFLARDSIYAIARYMPSPVRPSVRLSVCPSVRHTGGSVKDV